MRSTAFDVKTGQPSSILKCVDGVQGMHDMTPPPVGFVMSNAQKPIQLGEVRLHRIINTFSNGVLVTLSGVLDEEGEEKEVGITLPSWNFVDFGGAKLGIRLGIKVNVANVVIVSWSAL